MKKFLTSTGFIAISIFLLHSCKKFSSCRLSGAKQIEQYVLSGFNKVETSRNIELHIQQATSQSITVEADKNLLADFKYRISDSTLYLDYDAGCIFRDEETKITVLLKTDQLRQIRNSSHFGIYSVNTLTFPEVTLISENYRQPDSPALGDFILNVDNQRIKIISNNLSQFQITGRTQQLQIHFYGGFSRFEGQNLTANDIYVFHRSSNDLLLFPVNSLSGEIRSTGNVLIFNEPNSINVAEHFTGTLIRVY